ncbi:hypothetical protein F4819DRAFT_491959 [Hypoxylon fuscum]|nr:hypothetical protein F4819DRAFT_491959 [Hypoxylon fuscum]
MRFIKFTIALVGVLTAALPTDNFRGDSLLQISKDNVDSSYDTKRTTFKADPMLHIAKDSTESSYDA